jgi:hypothetical protein
LEEHIFDLYEDELDLLDLEVETFQNAKKHRDNRAIEALRTLNSNEAHMLARRMEECKPKSGSPCCSSLWCQRCRPRAAIGLQQRIEDHILREFGDHPERARERLVFATPLFDLAPLHDPARVRQTISQARQTLKKVTRSWPRMWWQGAFELELINFKELMENAASNPVKSETISAMWDWNGQANLGLVAPQVLVHAHILVDLKKIPRDQFTGRLRELCNKADRQVDVRSIRKDQSLEELAFKLGSYPFKDRVQFNMSFETQSYKTGRYFSDQELGRLVLLHHHLRTNGFKNLLIGSNARLARGIGS